MPTDLVACCHVAHFGRGDAFSRERGAGLDRTLYDGNIAAGSIVDGWPEGSFERPTVVATLCRFASSPMVRKQCLRRTPQ
jgi:hypothetical protein